VEAALAKYDQAFRSKNVTAIGNLLADDMLLYEHSVCNVTNLMTLRRCARATHSAKPRSVF
jgi:hypothetical protein